MYHWCSSHILTLSVIFYCIDSLFAGRGLCFRAWDSGQRIFGCHVWQVTKWGPERERETPLPLPPLPLSFVTPPKSITCPIWQLSISHTGSHAWRHKLLSASMLLHGPRATWNIFVLHDKIAKCCWWWDHLCICLLMAYKQEPIKKRT